MDLELTDDQRELAAVAQGVLDRHAPISLAREMLAGDGDLDALWGAIDEGGWYAIGLDEDDPFGLPGLCLLARECGAHVAPTLLVDTALAARLGLPDDVAAALAVLEPTTDWGLADLATTAVEQGGGHVLNGTKVLVPHAARAGLLAVLAATDDGPKFFFVDPAAQGVTLSHEESLDPSSAPFRVTFDDVLVTGGPAVAADDEGLERAMAIGAVATAAEAVGAASRALDLAVEYALEREQFGRPIGRFQAVQHILADGHVLRETAWSTVLFAAAALDERTPDALEAAHIAKAHASLAAREVVEAALQVFGGVAFTWEHDVHLFQRRVLDCERRFGDTIHHEALLADSIASASAAAVAS